MDKKSLRVQCLAARNQLDAAYIQSATVTFTQHLMHEIPKSGVIAGYLAIRGEMDVRPALNLLAERGHLLCLPVVTEKNAPLVFRHWEPGLVLERDAHDIEVPQDSQPLRIPDVVIVPLAAFDKAGHRLGYGSGYYDKTIQQLRRDKKNVRIIGAAYSIQQVDSIPSESHDQKLDAVVTEKSVLRLL